MFSSPFLFNSATSVHIQLTPQFKERKLICYYNKINTTCRVLKNENRAGPKGARLYFQVGSLDRPAVTANGSQTISGTNPATVQLPAWNQFSKRATSCERLFDARQTFLFVRKCIAIPGGGKDCSVAPNVLLVAATKSILGSFAPRQPQPLCLDSDEPNHSSATCAFGAVNPKQSVVKLLVVQKHRLPFLSILLSHTPTTVVVDIRASSSKKVSHTIKVLPVEHLSYRIVSILTQLSTNSNTPLH